MNKILDENFACGGLPDAPLMVEFEPTDICNLRCKMCHVTYRPSEVRHILPLEFIDKLDCIRGAYVALGSGFEPTIYPHIIPLLNRLSDLKCGLEIITNGVALRGDVARALYDTDVKIINFSFDGASKETYESIRAGSSYDLVLENIVSAKEVQAKQDTFFAVNFTAMRSNITEISEAVALWDVIGIDQLRVLGLIIREYEPQLLDESLFPILNKFYKNLDDAAIELINTRRKISLFSPHFLRTDHIGASVRVNVKGDAICSGNSETRFVPRNRQHIQTIIDKDGIVRCRSPFTFVRVLFNGDVQLCYKFSIGNLQSQSMEEIWHGKRAQEVRDSLMNDDKHCETCDYFRYCLGSSRVDYEKIENHFSNDIIPLISLQTDNTIVLNEKLLIDQPRLVQSVGNLNIVQYKLQYLIIPQSMGDMDLSVRDINSIEGITFATNFRDAKSIALAMASRNAP